MDLCTFLFLQKQSSVLDRLEMCSFIIATSYTLRYFIQGPDLVKLIYSEQSLLSAMPVIDVLALPEAKLNH